MPNWTIVLQDEAHQPVVTWTLENAWIAKLSGPSLNSKSNEIAIESIEVVCERIEIA
jgi:phage tail-like protein